MYITVDVTMAGAIGIVVGNLLAIAGQVFFAGTLPPPDILVFLSGKLAQEQRERAQKQRAIGNTVTDIGAAIALVSLSVMLINPLVLAIVG